MDDDCPTCGAPTYGHGWCVSCTDRGRDRRWTSCQVADLTGVTYRRIDYWARTGMVRPTVEADGCGTRRWYSYTDVVRVRLVATLIAAGIHPTTVRQLLPGPQVPLTYGYLLILGAEGFVITEDELGLLPELARTGPEVLQVLNLAEEAMALDRAILHAWWPATVTA